MPIWKAVMNCCAFSSIWVLTGLLAAGCQATPTPAPEDTGNPASQPNILLILADDLGYADLGYNGSEIPTPNIDELAAQGMLLTNFHVAMTCSPTRSMLMSGTDAHVAGLGVMAAPTRPEHQGQPGYLGTLNFQVVSLADLLTDAGYNTYTVGKWHLGMDVENGPVARGFRRAFVSLDGAAHLGPWDWRGPQPAEYRDGEQLVHVGEDFYSTRDYTQRMIGYIEQDRAEGKPFFAYMAYTAPHWPLQAPDEAIARFKGWYDDGYEALYLRRFQALKERGRVPPDATPADPDRFSPRWSEQSDKEQALASRRMEIYAAMVSELDRYIGELIAYLKSIDEYDNTFILFLSDNGAEYDRRDLRPPISEHVGKEYDQSLDNLGRANSYVMYGANWAMTSATPFRGYKFTGFEGGIHVPAFAHQPARVTPGTQSAAFLTAMDVLPTFVALADGRVPTGQYRGRDIQPVQGTSFLSVVEGRAEGIHPADLVYGVELWGQRSITRGDWKIVWDAREGDQARWKLFHLAEDVGERHDLAEDHPEQLSRMIQAWDEYAQRNGVIYFNGF